MNKSEKIYHPAYSANRDFIAMTAPLFLMAFFFYGPRVLLMALVAVITARLTDRLAALLRGRLYDRTENSSVTTALLIVLMMPATVRYRVVIMAVFVGVLVAKEAFGGYGSYPFNPAAVGFCVATVSWPDEMLRYPAPLNWMLQPGLSVEQLVRMWNFEGASLVQGPSMTLRSGGLPKIGFWDLLLGNYAGPLGISCTLVIVACAVYLLVRKRITLEAPLTFMATIALFAFVFPRYTDISLATFPQDFMLRLQVVKFETMSGAIAFAAVFMLNEPCTSPKRPLARVIYGFLLGFAAMMFRYYGTYELGTCFAILIVNAITGFIDRGVDNLLGWWNGRRGKAGTPAPVLAVAGAAPAPSAAPAPAPEPPAADGKPEQEQP